jgi:hypothetical protein
MKALKFVGKVIIAAIGLPFVVVYQICLIIIQYIAAVLIYIIMRNKVKRVAAAMGADTFTSNMKINWFKKVS